MAHERRRVAPSGGSLLAALMAAVAWLGGCGEFTSGDAPGGGGAGAGTSTSTSTTSTSSTGAGGGGGHGGTVATGGSGGGSGGGGAAFQCTAGTLPIGTASLYSNLDSEAEVVTPAIGNGQGAAVTSAINFPPSPAGHAARVHGDNQYISYVQQPANVPNLTPKQGVADFCYRPSYAHLDDTDHPIFGYHVPSGLFVVYKASLQHNNAIRVHAEANGATAGWSIPTTTFEFHQGKWYRLTIGWSLSGNGPSTVAVAVDGQDLPLSSETNPMIVMPEPCSSCPLFLGSREPMHNRDPLALFDELYVFQAPPITDN